DETQLPDERYAIRLVYFDQNQIRELKRIYDARLNAFLREVDAAWDVVHHLYEKRKKTFLGFSKNVVDFEDLMEKMMPSKWVKERKAINNDPDELHWNKLQFRDPPNTFVEKNNRTYTAEIKNVGEKINYLQRKLQEMFGYQNPVERVVIDERLNMLEKEFNRFIYEINPHHLQPGLLLDVDMTTTKRKQYMMKGMANVLNEFLHGISQGFADAAFASFKRRRSTVRTDIDQSFGDETEGESASSLAYSGGMSGGGSSDGGNDTPPPAASAPPTGGGGGGSDAGGGVKGSADVTPKSYEDKLKEMGLKEL
ncbi:MAG: cytochrome C oxidase subunit II, partial [Leptospiraceae bacterium]|nr:cytochrome C oxidase subunit II [Leptospiraceae bacterium]